MKNLLLLILLNPFLFVNSQTKEDFSTISCKYEISMLKDTLDNSSRIEELGVLLIGGNKSLFKSQIKYESDSLRQAIAKRGFENQNMAGIILQDLKKLPKPNYTWEVYKNNETVKILSKIFVHNYSFESNKKIDWKLLPEKKTISTYECKKAVGKYGSKMITAWYTMEVPISEGPYNFKGLPGLIVEAYDDKGHNHFLLKQLKKTVVKIIPEKKVIETSYDKFLKKRKEFLDNPSGEFSGFIKPEMREKYITKEKNDAYNARVRKFNNYLD